MDARIRMPDGETLVPEGAFVQFVLDTEGDGLDDPLEYFDTNADGYINSPVEAQALREWINAGADPSTFSDDELLRADDWDGTTLVGADTPTVAAYAGEIFVYPINPYYITNGDIGDQFGWRCWSLSPDELAMWGGQHGEQLWYTTGREYGQYDLQGVPYEGWRVGGASHATRPEDWNYSGDIGYEVYMSYLTGDPAYRSENRLDHNLTPVPEPATLTLLAVGALMLLGRIGKTQRRV